MWCTRWFLPLLLLPLPTAPPYFLLLFLISLTMHARPCFYCIILLSTLFISSCYWQPFPLDSSLSVPWSENITTFSDALNATISLDYKKPLPSVMRAVDRCWCDFSTNGLFEPYNVSLWERLSVEKLKAELERKASDEILQAHNEEKKQAYAEMEQNISTPEASTLADDADDNRSQCDNMPRTLAPNPDSTLVPSLQASNAAGYRNLWDIIRPLFPWSRSAAVVSSEGEVLSPDHALQKEDGVSWGPGTPLPGQNMAPFSESSASSHSVETELPDDTSLKPEIMHGPSPLKVPLPDGSKGSAPILSDEATAPVETHSTQLATPTQIPLSDRSHSALPWLRREYDLRPYGLAVIVDFGWSRDT